MVTVGQIVGMILESSARGAVVPRTFPGLAKPRHGGEDSGYTDGNGSNAFTVDGTNATNNYFADILRCYRIP